MLSKIIYLFLKGLENIKSTKSFERLTRMLSATTQPSVPVVQHLDSKDDEKSHLNSIDQQSDSCEIYIGSKINETNRSTSTIDTFESASDKVVVVDEQDRKETLKEQVSLGNEIESSSIIVAHRDTSVRDENVISANFVPSKEKDEPKYENLVIVNNSQEKTELTKAKSLNSFENSCVPPNQIERSIDLMKEKSNLNKTYSYASIASNLSSHSQSSRCLEQRQQQAIQEMAELPEWIKDNTRIIVSTNTVMNKTGHIRFIGPTKFAHGVWIGVELDQPFGKNDGSLNNVRYFTCPENRGVFVKIDKISLYNNKLDHV